MNVLILTCQSILFGLLIQYEFLNQAEARQIDYALGGYYGSLETKPKASKHNVNKSTKTSTTLIPYVSRVKRETYNDSSSNSEDSIYFDFFKSREHKDMLLKLKDVKIRSEAEKRKETDPLINTSIPEEEQDDELQQLKRKIKIKSHKRTMFKHKASKHKPVLAQKIKKSHNKKQVKPVMIRKKFVKSGTLDKFNVSESNESVRREKPVDIIVHIKMNEYR